MSSQQKRKHEESDAGLEIVEFLPLAQSAKRRKPQQKKKSTKKNTKEDSRSEEKYRRGAKVNLKAISDKKVRGTLKKKEVLFGSAAKHAAASEVLLTQQGGYLEPENDMERTYKVSQQEIVRGVDVASSRKVFDLTLKKGPYSIDYTANGRFLLMGGKRGHVGMTDWANGKLHGELELDETVNDVKFLHNETMFAVAQQQYVYIYDSTGMELHCLRSHIEVNRLDFLRYHWLLTSVSNAGFLKYHDTSTGQLVAEHRTRLGRCDTMRANAHNAIVHLGHANGCVTLWSPNMSSPLVRMLCHRGPVLAVAFDGSGNNMITSGLDGQVKVWDLRTYNSVHSYYTMKPTAALDVSQTGLLATGWGGHVQVWRDAIATKAQAPYMSHLIEGSLVRDVQFVPHEDVLGVGHSKGFSSLLIPGAGNPNFDSFEANPFQTKKQRQEAEVHGLLEKIPAELITLNPDHVGTVDRAAQEVVAEERRKEYEANHPKEKFEPKHKKRGRSSAAKRQQRKQKNVIDKQRMEREQRKASFEARAAEPEPSQSRSVLDRFKVSSKGR